jgi:uncharacterized Zn-finger protein
MKFNIIWPLYVLPYLVLILPRLLFTDTSVNWSSHHPISDNPSTFRSFCENIAMSNDSAWTKCDHHLMFDRCVNQQEYGAVEQVVTPWSPSELKPKGLFPCPTCGKRYNYKHNLGRHVRQECGKEPQFHCPYCSHVTKHKASLQKHIHRKHTEMPNIKWGEDIHAMTPFTLVGRYRCFRGTYSLHLWGTGAVM